MSIGVLLVLIGSATARDLPEGFVYLRDFAPTIRQDLRYYGSHNFIGRPIPGYLAPECILTAPAAHALAAVQADIAPSNLSLVVYDCYRPQRAVNDFVSWGQNAADQAMKAEFYPRVDKADFVKLGYVADKSSHTRGSTVDLAIVPLPLVEPAPYRAEPALSRWQSRFWHRLRLHGRKITHRCDSDFACRPAQPCAAA
jgi:D-alanyl-D-alanine dipeptidase